MGVEVQFMLRVHKIWIYTKSWEFNWSKKRDKSEKRFFSLGKFYTQSSNFCSLLPSAFHFFMYKKYISLFSNAHTKKKRKRGRNGVWQNDGVRLRLDHYLFSLTEKPFLCKRKFYFIINLRRTQKISHFISVSCSSLDDVSDLHFTHLKLLMI